MTKRSEMTECTVVPQCMLTTFGKALISVAHQITSVTNTCQSSVPACPNVLRFGCFAGKRSKWATKRSVNEKRAPEGPYLGKFVAFLGILSNWV